MTQSIMDTIHIFGCLVIGWLQENGQPFSVPLQAITELGNPSSSLHVAFPIAFFIGGRMFAYRALWTCVISEWLNGVLKWVLHGERPYWWFQEHSQWLPENFKLHQFPATCEIGPGSPSGHCMVSASVWFILLHHYCYSSSSGNGDKAARKWVSWFVFLAVLVGVAVSRCYIATHFPHQVAAGIVAGVTIGVVMNSLQPERVSACCSFITGVGLFAGVVLFRQSLFWLQVDPEWSVKLAVKHCAQATWIHFSTSLLFAFSRDSAILFGVGVDHLLLGSRKAIDSGTIPYIISWSWLKGMALFLSILGAYFLENVALVGPNVALHWFYATAILKITLIPLFVMRVVPWMLSCILVQ